MGISAEILSIALAAVTLVWFTPLILYSLERSPSGVHRVGWFLTLLLLSWPAYALFLVYSRLGESNNGN